MEYEWDENKRQANLAKHGVDFIEIEGFDWQSALISPDSRRDYREARNIALGFIGARLFAAVFTIRGAAIRIIGLRKANKREQKNYENQA